MLGRDGIVRCQYLASVLDVLPPQSNTWLSKQTTEVPIALDESTRIMINKSSVYKIIA